MKILVTGSQGFIGKNLCSWVKNAGYNVLSVDLNNLSDLDKYVPEDDFIIHLAGINRLLDPKEFLYGNVNSKVKVTKLLRKHKKKTPILIPSSTQAANDNDYGRSKKQAEDYLFKFAKTNKSPVYIYRFQNVFGKRCRPNYNSVVATWCYERPLGLNAGSIILGGIKEKDVLQATELAISMFENKEPNGLREYYDVTNTSLRVVIVI